MGELLDIGELPDIGELLDIGGFPDIGELLYLGEHNTGHRWQCKS